MADLHILHIFVLEHTIPFNLVRRTPTVPARAALASFRKKSMTMSASFAARYETPTLLI